jgi:hypothetical protein
MFETSRTSASIIPLVVFIGFWFGLYCGLFLSIFIAVKTRLVDGCVLSAEDAAPLGLDSLLVLGLQRCRAYGAGKGACPAGFISCGSCISQVAAWRSFTRLKLFVFCVFYCG